MNLKGNDDKHPQKKLDMEFQRILRIIKPYIPCIMNNHYLTFYRMWLEKLSELGIQEKEERNRYLIELCHQIQDGILEKPFTDTPPAGSLPPLRSYLHNDKVHLKQQDITHAPYRNTLEGTKYISKVVNTSQNKPENWKNEVYNKFLKNRSKTMEVPPNNLDNVEISNDSYKKRNHYSVLQNIQKRHSIQRNRIDDVLVELSKLPKYIHKTQFISESKLQEKYPQKQQQDFTNKYGSKTETKCINKRKLSSPRNTHPMEKKVLENVFFMPQNLKRKNPFQHSTSINMTTNKEGDGGDSSWCDLTDVSSTTRSKFGSGDLLDNVRSPTRNHSGPGSSDNQNYLYELYDARITDLMNIIAELQKQNLSLNEDVAKYERDLSLRNIKAETSIHNLADEVKSLKSGLQELTEIKKALKNNYFTALSQWQTAVNTLNKELYVTRNHNLALKTEIIDLKKELEALSIQKQKFQDDPALKQKLCDIHAKKVKSLKQTHTKQISSIEEKFGQILTQRENAFSQRQKELKNYYEKQILDIVSAYDKTVNNRNVEIQRLESTIEKQYNKMHDEVRGIRSHIQEHSNVNDDSNLEKIAVLQKCLSKMERLFKKAEKKYVKHIAKLKHEIEVKDKAIEIQLTTQRAELVANTNSKRQVETDATVMLLEERYRKLLENQHAQFLSDKRNDAKLISNLRAMLAKN